MINDYNKLLKNKDDVIKNNQIKINELKKELEFLTIQKNKIINKSLDDNIFIKIKKLLMI